MFTKHRLDLYAQRDEKTPFRKFHYNIDTILNHIAPYSEQAELNPFKTFEFPSDIDTVGGKCYIFDSYDQLCSNCGDKILAYCWFQRFSGMKLNSI